MADYCTLAQVRTELVKQGSAAIDDAAITERIPRVTQLVNNYCQHSFDNEVITNEMRTGEQAMMSPDNELIVSVKKGNCQGVTACSVSQDFVSWSSLVPSMSYVDQTGPIGYIVHFVNPSCGLVRGVRIYARISYAGGFAVLPDDLVGIACRWTAFLYMKRQAPFEITAFPQIGEISIPSAIPSDIIQNLNPYVRRRP